MKLIGITGPTGSGKSLLCEYLASRNVVCIDADSVYHSMLTPPSDCLDAIRKSFGGSVFNADGTLDRTALGKIVFSNEEKLALLNDTVLGFVVKNLLSMVDEYRTAGHTAVAIDAPTLIESGLNKSCDTVITVTAPREARAERIRLRDSLTEERAWQRINAQKDDEFYISHSDIVLINDGESESFCADAQKALEDILGAAEAK